METRQVDYKIGTTLKRVEYLKSKIAKLMEINKATLSLALNNKPISFNAMLKIAKFFKVDSREIFD